MTASPNTTALPDLADLVRRMDLEPQLLRRRIEEEITLLVPIAEAELSEAERQLVGDQGRDAWLAAKGWTPDDLHLHLRRPMALQRYAQQQFGPGLEELFLAAQGSRDEVIYSMLRVRERGLAWELYLRLAEGELTFPEAASHFGEGPEAQRKGVIGPIAIGQLHPPVLREWLRTLQPGEVRPPQQLGEWQLILRLEQLSPARLDDAMRQTLLDEQLHAFLMERVSKLQAGEPVEPLHYDQQA
jgi:hypothetical protein